MFTGGARRSAPHPRFGPGVQPSGAVGRRMVNFLGVDKGLSGKRFPAQQPPPRFHQIEPRGLDRNEQLLEARVLG